MFPASQPSVANPVEKNLSDHIKPHPQSLRRHPPPSSHVAVSGPGASFIIGAKPMFVKFGRPAPVPA